MERLSIPPRSWLKSRLRHRRSSASLLRSLDRYAEPLPPPADGALGASDLAGEIGVGEFAQEGRFLRGPVPPGLSHEYSELLMFLGDPPLLETDLGGAAGRRRSARARSSWRLRRRGASRAEHPPHGSRAGSLVGKFRAGARPLWSRRGPQERSDIRARRNAGRKVAGLD